MRNVFSPSALSSPSVRRAPSASHQLMRPTPKMRLFERSWTSAMCSL